MNSPPTPTDLGLTQFQLNNLHKLLAYAKAHPDIPFDMRYYITLPDFSFENYETKVKPTYPCGTSCCLAGMGVFAGIEPEPTEYWNDYIERVFTRPSGDTFDYLFSEDHQNSLPHAIARLEDFLTNGLPQDIYFTTVATWFFAGISANDEDIFLPAVCFIVLGAVFVAGYQCGQEIHFNTINSNFQLLPK